jgi:2-polyprenyl-3-methyl-5-hydroxy-6-metoxy-1,4-benzoquinol methylase
VLEWYLRVKLKLDRNYELFNRYSVPEGHITDIGCGYGFISYMLYFISDKRRITGIDLDADKVEVANNCISKNNNLQFICADIVSYQFEKADTFILCDVLHYITFEQQKQLIHKCINNLNPGGSILIRDGDASLETKHNRTKFTEFFSTHTGFNKAEYKDLVFLNRNMLKEIALQNGLDFEIIENKKFTSNVLFILKRGEL